MAVTNGSYIAESIQLFRFLQQIDCIAAPLLVGGNVTGMFIRSREIKRPDGKKPRCVAPDTYLNIFINLAGDSSARLCPKKTWLPCQCSHRHQNYTGFLNHHNCVCLQPLKCTNGLPKLRAWTRTPSQHPRYPQRYLRHRQSFHRTAMQ